MPNQSKKQSKPKVLTDVTQILNVVQRQKTAYASNYWVPSLEKDVKFCEINTSQQKRLIKSIVDSPVYNTEFIQTFRDVLRENCTDDVDIDELTVIDKLLLALGLRISCVGNMIDLEIQPDPEEEPKAVPVDLMKVYDSAKKALTNIKAEMFEDKLFVVECNVPTIGTEYRLEREFRVDNENIEIETNKELRDTIGEAFIDEVVKYVSDVSLKSGDGITEITWNKFNFADRIQVVESFSTSLLKDIISFINNVKKETNKVEIAKFAVKKKKYDRRLTIDGSFFMIS